MTRQQKKALRERQSTRQLMGVKELTDHGVKTADGELVFYLIAPDNLSVLSAVVGVYDINLDAGAFSMLDAKAGWETHRVREVSTAVYYAANKELTDWITKRNSSGSGWTGWNSCLPSGLCSSEARSRCPWTRCASRIRSFPTTTA